MRAWIDCPGLESSPDAGAIRRHQAADAAAHDDYFRLQQVNYIAEPNGQMAGGLFQNLLRQFIAAACGFVYGLRGYVGNISASHFQDSRMVVAALAEQAAGACGNCGAGGVHLHAPALAAAAERPVEVDAHMAAFTAAAGSSVVNLSPADHRCADAGPQTHVKDACIFGAGAPFCFGERSRTGVVGEPGGQAVVFFDPSRQGKVSPAWQVRGAEQHPSFAVYPSWRAHADCWYARLCRAHARHHAIYSAQHGVKSLLGAAARNHRGARGMQNLASRVHQADGHFRAADINTQDESVRACGADAILQRLMPSWRFTQLG